MLRRLLLLLLLSSSAAFACAQTPASSLKFAVVSVKPSGNPNRGWNSGFTTAGFHASNVTLKWIIDNDAFLSPRYRVPPNLSWIETARFDVEAKVSDEDLEAYQHLTRAERQPILQNALAERFHLAVHSEMIPTPVYTLTIAKAGPKLTETPIEQQMRNTATGEPMALFIKSRPGSVEARDLTVANLADYLSRGASVGRPVLDRSGLTGRYNIALHWTPENASPDSPLAGGPSIFTALEEQLGLKLEPTTAPLEFLILDHAEQPTEN